MRLDDGHASGGLDVLQNRLSVVGGAHYVVAVIHACATPNGVLALRGDPVVVPGKFRQPLLVLGSLDSDQTNVSQLGYFVFRSVFLGWCEGIEISQKVGGPPRSIVFTPPPPKGINLTASRQVLRIGNLRLLARSFARRNGEHRSDSGRFFVEAESRIPRKGDEVHLLNCHSAQANVG